MKYNILCIILFNILCIMYCILLNKAYYGFVYISVGAVLTSDDCLDLHYFPSVVRIASAALSC